MLNQYTHFKTIFVFDIMFICQKTWRRKMAVCQICGKKTAFGNSVAHSATTTKRKWKPNLQRVRAVLPDGSVKRIYVCAKCLKAGKVIKAVK